VTDERTWTAAELEGLTPDERHRLVNERVVTDLSELSPEFLATARLEGQALLEERKATDPTQS
jgi:hypothetical protein